MKRAEDKKGVRVRSLKYRNAKPSEFNTCKTIKSTEDRKGRSVLSLKYKSVKLSNYAQLRYR